MLKYNFRGFFKGDDGNSVRVYHNSDWVSNAHFICKKNILLKSQKDFINKHEVTESKINALLKNIIEAEQDRFYKDTDESMVFKPTHIRTYEDRTHNILYDEVLDLAVRETYYNYFTKRQCTLYKGKGKVNPLPIGKNSDFVGVLLPCRINQETCDKLILITDYYAQFKQ